MGEWRPTLQVVCQQQAARVLMASSVPPPFSRLGPVNSRNSSSVIYRLIVWVRVFVWNQRVCV